MEKKRDEYDPTYGETCSLTDRVFQDDTSLQKLTHADYVYANPCQAEELDHSLVIGEYAGMMHEHIERRILFAFQQFIACYQTKLHFESVGAKNQGKSAEAVFLSDGGDDTKFVVRNAAHSCGNPRLIAYDQQQWEQFLAGNAPKPQGFVFLKGTDYYRIVNATMNMPRWINEADREIDEKRKTSLLRAKGNAIINRVSQGELTPDEAIMEYIRDALSEVRTARRRLGDLRKDPEVREVLSYYEDYLVEIEQAIVDDPSYLGRFLDLRLGTATENERAKRAIFQIRYAAIRNAEIGQAALIQKVEALRNEILGHFLRRKPDHFDAAFRTVFIESARSVDNRIRLEKLLIFPRITLKRSSKGAKQDTWQPKKPLRPTVQG